jgi:hypothetical protein
VTKLSAQNIVRVCKNLKRLVLDCDFYGRAIRYIISSLSGSLEVLWLQGRNYNDSMCQELSKCSRCRKWSFYSNHPFVLMTAICAFLQQFLAQFF